MQGSPCPGVESIGKAAAVGEEPWVGTRAMVQQQQPRPSQDGQGGGTSGDTETEYELEQSWGCS